MAWVRRAAWGVAWGLECFPILHYQGVALVGAVDFLEEVQPEVEHQEDYFPSPGHLTSFLNLPQNHVQEHSTIALSIVQNEIFFIAMWTITNH